MSLDILHRVEAYIQQERLLTPGDGVVVALSGGPDSVTLFDLLHRLKAKWDLTLYIAHLNHQLRPQCRKRCRVCQTDRPQLSRLYRKGRCCAAGKK